MKFTDIFVRRLVLAIVVSLVTLIADSRPIRSLNGPPVPEASRARRSRSTATHVGANADLSAGFITTPARALRRRGRRHRLHRVAEHAGCLSTINVRLKLNFSACERSSPTSARASDQVRADLPPEAEVPSILIEPSDAQIAAMYLSFGSTILEDNQVTDYLIRVVQPRLSAIEGVQRADILGARTFAIRAWLKPDRMAALNVSPAQVRAALAANNYLAAVGTTKGALIQINLTTTTDLESRSRSSRSSSCASKTGRSVRPKTWPTWSWAPTPTIRTSGSPATARSSWASGSSRTPTRSTSSPASGRKSTSSGALAQRMDVGDRGLRLDRVHQQRHPRGRARR